jgi:hypothetical protein
LGILRPRWNYLLLTMQWNSLVCKVLKSFHQDSCVMFKFIISE